MLIEAPNVSRKRPNPQREVIQLRADADWINRVNAEAERLGLSLSAYIRLAVNERMERTAQERGQDRKRT